jgi:hypothetical protein
MLNSPNCEYNELWRSFDITYFPINDHRPGGSIGHPREALQHEQKYPQEHADCIEYKAQWLNYHPSQATWETMENLQHAKEMIDKFNGQAFANELVRPKGIDSMATNGLKANTSNESMGPKRGRGRPPKKLKSFGEPQSPISLDKSSSRQKMHE